MLGLTIMRRFLTNEKACTRDGVRLKVKLTIT